jgi:Family of unknown function (DUF5947)
MNMQRTENSLGVLGRFVRRGPAIERCDLCGAALALDHQHVLEPGTGRLICACQACAILFGNQGKSRYLRVPRRILLLRDFQLTDGQWESLAIPINMAFFVRSVQKGRVVAYYPSPAGAIESTLPLDAWSEIANANPILVEMQPDVEALLVIRESRDHQPAESCSYLLPIDETYRLVGLIRSRWKGLSGGAEVWENVSSFLASLREKANA